MKIKKIDYQICCDVPGCGRLSTYSLTFTDDIASVHICEECATSLAKELKKIGVKA